MISSRIIRSLLFVPTDKLKFMEKSFLLNSDAIVFDLEDSVASDKKAESRVNLLKFLNSQIHHRDDLPNLPYCTVRINCPHSSIYGKEDIELVRSLKGIDAIVIPKVDDEQSLNQTVSLINKPAIALWAMIETSLGVINVEKISAHKSIEAIVFGSNDLTKDIKAKFNNDRIHLHYSMSKCIIAARAAKKLVFDGVYMDINNQDGLASDCLLGKSFGFDGKSLIHPNQIDLTNDYFSPSIEEVQYAKRVIAAYDNARLEAKSVAVLDGKLIEYLHVHEASAVIKRFHELEKLKRK